MKRRIFIIDFAPQRSHYAAYVLSVAAILQQTRADFFGRAEILSPAAAAGLARAQTGTDLKQPLERFISRVVFERERLGSAVYRSLMALKVQRRGYGIEAQPARWRVSQTVSLRL